LLTKTDLVAADELAELDRKLKALNPGATRKIAPDEIFGTALLILRARPIRRWRNESAYQGHTHGIYTTGSHTTDKRTTTPRTPTPAASIVAA